MASVVPVATPFKFVRSEGTPVEVGRTHGEAFGDQVLGSISVYRDRFAEAGVPWEAALERAARGSAALRAFSPALADELDGIAQGAGVDPREIVAINMRTGIMRMAKSPNGEELNCTSVAVTPQATASGHTLVAQNWDAPPVLQPNTVVIEQHTEGEPAILFRTEAGILFGHGMNDAGIGILGNSLKSDAERDANVGMPTPVARRRAMRTRSLEDAHAAIEETPRAHSGNHVLADAKGFAVSLEATPERVFVVHPLDGVLAHSNHFLSPEAVTTFRDCVRESHPDTLVRDCRVRHALQARRGNITVEDIKFALRDHYGFPKSVCRHPDEDAPPTDVQTLASMVMDLTERRLWIAPGLACTGTYTEYSFS